MPWTVTFDAGPAIVHTTFTGLVPPEDLEAAVQATLALAVAHGALRFLADCRGLEGGHSLFDLFEKAQRVERSGLSRCVREAVVMPANVRVRSDVQFWETVARNRGFEVRVFPDLDSAVAWLTEAAAPAPG
mgnify:CR=1 FL=1